ncbi:VMAP-C domain-containing protein [Streptomyces cyaneofuscatus]
MGSPEIAHGLTERRNPPPHKAVQQALVHILHDVPTLADSAPRRALARMLAHSLNRPFTPQTAEMQLHEDHLSFIVARCMEQDEPTEATDALARAVGTVTGDDEVADQVRRLSDLQLAQARFAEDVLDKLQEVLAGAGSQDVRHIARACMRPFPVHLPRHCTDAWSVLLHLMRRNALPDGLPLFLLFLERLASTLEGALQERVRSWVDAYARDQKLDGPLIQQRSRIAADPASEEVERDSRIMLVLLPDGLDEDYCELRVWHQPRHGEQAPPLPHGDARVHRHDLEQTVGERLGRVLEHVERSAAVTVEFWLPVALANLPVVRWCHRIPHARQRPVLRIVVRSLDRPRTPESRHSWKLQWARMMDGRHPEGESRSVSASGISGAMAWDHRLLVLDAPPDEREGREQLRKGILSGAPVILWHRSDCASEAFRQSVQRLVGAGPLAELPTRLVQLQTGPGSLEQDALSDLTLLWDDPNRPLTVLKALTSPDAVSTP